MPTDGNGDGRALGLGIYGPRPTRNCGVLSFQTTTVAISQADLKNIFGKSLFKTQDNQDNVVYAIEKVSTGRRVSRSPGTDCIEVHFWADCCVFRPVFTSLAIIPNFWQAQLFLYALLATLNARDATEPFQSNGTAILPFNSLGDLFEYDEYNLTIYILNEDTAATTDGGGDILFKTK